MAPKDSIEGLDVRPSPDFPSLRISSDGRVMGPMGRWLKPVTEPRGYQAVKATSGGRRHRVRVHVLVCTTFHGPRPSPQYEVAHWNGDASDNRAANLRWATHTENMADMARHGTLPVGEQRWNAKMTAEQVVEIRKRRQAGLTYKRLAEEFGVSVALIRSIVCRRSWAHL